MRMTRRILLALATALMGAALCGAMAACGERKEGGTNNNEPADPGTQHTHVVENWTTLKEPDCVTAGTKTGECTTCHETVTESIPALGHLLTKNVGLPLVYPTCTEPGRKLAQCTREGCDVVQEVSMPALGHNWQSVEVLEEPTCMQAGKRKVHCDNCNTDGELEIPMLEHEWESFFTVDTEADFDHAGSRSVHCRNCDTKKDVTVIPQLEANTPILYQFNLVRNSGAAINFAGIGYEVYEGGAKVAEGTFRNGAAVQMLLPKTYTVQLKNLPGGYSAEENYTVQATSPVCNLNITGSVIQGDMPSGHLYAVGSSMYDFTLTSTGEQTLKLSDLLQTKKAVVLNFWYVGCVWCRTEFPGMVEAYKQYKDDIEVIAINSPTSEGRDSMKAATDFASEMKLNFSVVHGPQGDPLMNAFNVQSFPTTVVIDSEGVVSEIHASALVEDTNGDGQLTSADDSTRLFQALFKKYAEASNSPQTAQIALPVKKKD